MLAIHCMPDHTHLFVGIKPTVLISDFIKEVKVESNEFINNKKWLGENLPGKRLWCVFLFSFSYWNRELIIY